MRAAGLSTHRVKVVSTNAADGQRRHLGDGALAPCYGWLAIG
jgi:hypothetical protein